MEEERKPRRAGNKSRKKGWKATDITEIEELQEDERKEDRQGGKVSEKANDALFFVDSSVSAEPQLSKRQKRKLMQRKDDSDDEDEQPFVSKKEKFMKKLESDEQKGVDEREEELKTAEKTDLWLEVPKEQVEGFLESTIKFEKRVPASFLIKNPVLIEPVEVAAPGASYNPDFDDHQVLLRQAHEVELNKLKKELRLNKQVKMVTVDQMKKHAAQYMKEMSEGLIQTKKKKGAESSDEEEDVDKNCLSDRVSVCPVSADDKKTRQTRRRENEEKEKAKEKLAEKEEKAKLQDVFRLKTLNKEIKAEDKKSELRKQEKMEKMELAKRRPKRVGRQKFEVQNTEVALSEELSGNMRSFKPEGSLLTDRFKSMQKRNLIEPRKPVIKHRKYRLKQYEKKSHKVKCIKEIKK